MAVKINGTNLVYFPVPKVACTSIKTAIPEHNDIETWKLFENGPRTAPPRHIHEVYPSTDFLLRNFAGVTLGKRWVTVVRDPIKRAVSGYRNRILFHRDLDETAPETLARLDLPAPPDLTTFALNLRAYCDANPST